MSWNIKTPGDYINGPLTVAGASRFNSNVGIGIAPSAGSSDYYRTFEIGKAGCGLFAATTSLTSSELVFLSGNGVLAYNAGPEWKYGNNGAAAIYGIEDGIHKWYNNSSGSAGGVFVPTLSMLLGSDGNLGIGASPLARLHSSNGLTTDGGLFTGLMIGGSGASSARTASLIKNTSTPYDLIIRTQDFTSGTTGSLIVQNGSTEVFRVNTNAAAVLAGGNVNANGVGIAFPSAQSASTDANTLDDYEEGTWTATLKGSTADPTTPVTATGRYTKIGRQVNIKLAITGVDTTGASGSVQITGIPFAPGLIAFGVLQSEFGITFTGTLGCYINATATTIIASASASSGGRTDGTHNAGTNRWFWLNITYSV